MRGGAEAGEVALAACVARACMHAWRRLPRKRPRSPLSLAAKLCLSPGLLPYKREGARVFAPVFYLRVHSSLSVSYTHKHPFSALTRSLTQCLRSPVMAV
jgi:hypothetical protein